MLNRTSLITTLPCRGTKSHTSGLDFVASFCIATMAVCLSLHSFAFGKEAEQVDYLEKIKPLLATKCSACHGPVNQEAGLRLDAHVLIARGGDNGSVLEPGQPDKSVLLERILASGDDRMPPPEEGSALTETEIDLLRRWIMQGALAPAEESIPVAPAEHWAFQPITAVEIDPNSAISPIDQLLSRRQKEHGLVASAAAERSLLIRRLYLDLIGLPPTTHQLEDSRPIDEIIEELLYSPHHGERWGRHWMDVWRYTDWYGLGAQLRNSQKHIWHWRDWIVDSLNDDKGYDRMVLEMLAGDELEPENLDVIAGTGFLARNYYLFNRTTWLDATIEHTGKAFMGLTLNCAKCHDHKYDPISQLDYYRMRAIFEPHQVRLDPFPGTTDLEANGLPRVFDDHLDAETYLHVRGDPKNPDKSQKIAPGVPALFANYQPEIQPISLPVSAYAPVVRAYVQQDLLAASESTVKADEESLVKAKHVAELAAAQSAEPTEPVDPQPEKDDPTAEPFQYEDDFEKLNPEAWELVGNGWKFRDGALHQTVASREKAFARFLPGLPTDFDIRCRYTHTGGTTYKSVTFRFDQSEDSKFENFVYTSAHAPGPKLHIAFTRGGTTQYPNEGRAARPIKVGSVINLRFAVRGTLVNAWIDDQLVKAYRLPDRGVSGSFSLSGFDATAAFDWISIRSLSDDETLTEAGNQVQPPPTDPKQQLKIAEAKLRASQTRHSALEAILAAEQQKHDTTAASGQLDLELAKAAALLDAEALLAEAQYEQLSAGSDVKKVDAAKRKANDAQKQKDDIAKGNLRYSVPRPSRKALETPAHKEGNYAPVYSSKSSGRRLALARWLINPENPLTARVAVNHVWMRHFGQPLVESVFDFGLRAPRPLHADLLDWLAADFVESGWSMRHLHRRIVRSAAYQRTSSAADADASTLAKDPSNEYYWRAHTRRMEAQIVRDSLLALSGTLDRTMGGPSLDVGDKSRRRSLYFKHSRDQRDKFLSMFDDADLLQCYRRSESIVPQQALAMANGLLSLQSSATIAKAIEKECEDEPQRFIPLAFFKLLARPGTEKELKLCETYKADLRKLLESQSVPAAEIDARVRVRLVHALINHNDFISIR